MRISDWSSDVCSSDLVTLVYRRGPEAMGATGHEQAFARENGVIIRHWAQPVRLEGEAGAVRRAVFEHTCLTTAGRPAGTGRSEEPRVGKEGVSKCRFRGAPDP